MPQPWLWKWEAEAESDVEGPPLATPTGALSRHGMPPGANLVLTFLFGRMRSRPRHVTLHYSPKRSYESYAGSVGGREHGKARRVFVDHEFPCSISGGGSVPLAAYSNVQPAQESIATERHGSPFPVDMTIVNRALLLKNHRDRPKNQPIKKSQCRIG